MLQNLSDQLRSVQFVDQKSLAGALVNEQGLTSTDFTTNLTVSASPGSGVTQAAETKSIDSSLGSKTSGESSPNGSGSKSGIPSLDSAATFPTGFKPQFGENSSDLLGDQVNLTYQIFNLRMLLERSLTDRLWSDPKKRNDEARLQAVLGFNVTIDPPRTANDAVAVVEIRLSRICSKDEEAEDACAPKGTKPAAADLSLVSVMPQEKTYNSAALSSKSHAFGGSAAVNVVQIGYAQRRKAQTFFLYRDVDTVSYQKAQENKDEIVFGWRFRPVLGRHSISPGLRQLFAIVSLPTTERHSTGPGKGEQVLKAEIRTYWRKYDAGTLTSFVPEDANRASRFKFKVSATLAKPEIFSARYENKATYAPIAVKHVEEYEKALRPKVTAVTWRITGPNNVLVSVAGENFFTGTQVAMGGKVFSDTGNGLVIKSNQSFDLATTLDTLAGGSGAVIGRYGVAEPLIDNAGESQKSDPISVEFEDIRLGPVLNGFSQGWMTFTYSANGKPLGPVKFEDFKKFFPRQALYASSEANLTEVRSDPIISFNGKVVPPPYSYVETTDTKVGAIQINVPESYFGKGSLGGVARISWPFLPAEKWTLSKTFFDPPQAFLVTRLSADRLFITDQDQLGLWNDPPKNPDGTIPDHTCWLVAVGAQTYKVDDHTDECTFKAPTDEQAKGANKGHKTAAIGEAPARQSGHGILLALPESKDEKLVLYKEKGDSYVLDIPKSSEEAKKTKVVQVKQYDSTWIDIAADPTNKEAATLFSSLASAEANETRLPYRPKSAKDKVQVQLTRALTRHPGTIEITLSDKSGKVLQTQQVEILPAQQSNNGPPK